MTEPPGPGGPAGTVRAGSNVRIFAKSLHWLALGWAVGVVWLCIAQMRRGWLLDPTGATDYHVNTFFEGLAPAALVEAMAFFSVAWCGVAPTRSIERREWMQAFIWALLPNLMVLYTVYLMIYGDV
jgi:hypothetical protein